MRAIPALMLLALAGCHWKIPAKERTITPSGSAEDKAGEDALRREILADPAVRGIDVSSDRWEIAVADDGTDQNGRAFRICALLGERGFLTPGMEIRIVASADHARLLDRARCTIFPAKG